MPLSGPAPSEPRPSARPRTELHTAAILDHLNDPVLFVSLEGAIVDANRTAEAFYGYSREELLSLTVYEIRPPEDHPHIRTTIEAAILEPSVFQLEHVRRDGSRVPVEVSTRYLPEEARFISIVRDVTERRRSEERIRALNRVLKTRSAVDEAILREQDPDRLLQAVCDNAVRAGEWHGAIIGIAEPDGSIRVGAVSGLTPAHLDDQAMRWDEGPLAQGPGGRAVRERRTVTIPDTATDTTLPRRADTVARGVRSIACAPIPLRARVFGFLGFLASEPYVFAGEALDQMDLLAADIGFALQVIEDNVHHARERAHADSARQQLAAERDALMRRLSLQFDRMPVGCFVTDNADRVLAWNRTAERIFGYSLGEVLGREVIPLIVRDADAARIRSMLRRIETSDETVENVNENVRRDGSTILCHWTNVPLKDENGRLLGRMQMVQDITERRRLEEELRQAQKMEAVGRLAGGVAHDFNNILTIILGNCGEALAGLPDGHPQRANVSGIEQAAQRAAALTRQLLAFSRRQIMQPKAIRLNEVVEKTTAMLRRVIGADITLITRLHPHPGRVLVDPGQVEQILLNLCINARDAMPSGGTLTIETAPLHVGPQERLRDPAMSLGPHLCLTVRDTGIGIPEDVKRHLFEPFFTTKEPGQGTGLGLPTVYGIVRQSKGGIFVDSVEGGGAAFTVAFPITDATGYGDYESSPAPTAAERGSGCVLIAEDEPAVRSLTRRALSGAGYSVLEAGSGDEALAIAAEYPGKIDVLVTDVVMPGVGGPELARRLQHARPEIRVLYTSGYSETLALRGFKTEDVPFLQKPFTLAEIRTRVAALLRQPLES